MNSKVQSLVAAVALTALAGAAQATLVTTDAGYTGPVLNMSAYANGSYNFTFGPKSLPGGITFTSAVIDSNSGLGSVLGQGSYGLVDNGSFGGDAVYAGLDGPRGSMRFTLDAPVSSFGAYLNYAPGFGDNPFIAALDINGNVIESWDLSVFAPISTPGGFNEFRFRGIDVGTKSIYALELGGSYILATGTSNGLPPVPEPETYALMLLGLGVVGLVARRRAA